MGWELDPLWAGTWAADPFGCDVEVRDDWVFCRTHRVPELAGEIAAAGRKVLVSGASDACATDEARALLPAGMTWWSTNAVGKTVRPLPLGFVWDAARFEEMRAALGRPAGAVKSLLVCHTTYGPDTERARLYERFRRESWATCAGGRDAWEVPAREFYRLLRGHAFVLCPEGAGPDTHRIWEALAMGCVPVVKRHACHRAWRELPVLWVDSWDEVTMDRLCHEAWLLREVHRHGGVIVWASWWKRKICTG